MGLESGTCGLVVEDLTTGLQCYYAYVLYKLAIFLHSSIIQTYLLNRSSYEAGTRYKNQNVVNKQMKATIIVLNATLYKIVVCQHKKDSL